MRWLFLELPDIAAVPIFNNPPTLLQLAIAEQVGRAISHFHDSVI